MMEATPQKEHEWLQQLVGEWDYEAVAAAPGQESQKDTGSVRVRSLNGVWVVSDSGDAMGGSILTLGYDPERQTYVGAFVTGMMTHLWIYEGTLDATGKELVLDTEGPAVDGSGRAKYKDTVRIEGPDHWVLSSKTPGPDGKWAEFMTMHHRRRS